MQITVNGESVNVAPEDQITYDTIAGLAGHPGDQYLSITYHWRGDGDAMRSGILMPGKSVKLDEGMRFNAVHTGNA